MFFSFFILVSNLVHSVDYSAETFENDIDNLLALSISLRNQCVEDKDIKFCTHSNSIDSLLTGLYLRSVGDNVLTEIEKELLYNRLFNSLE